MAATVDKDVLNHFNISNPYPTEWPTELDSDDDDDGAGGIRRSRSRYSALERTASERKSLLPGSQRTGDGRANLVQKDEADPLGAPGSVVSNLRQRGLPVEADTRLKNKFMLSSTTFAPETFLATTHDNDTPDDLVAGANYLAKSIDQQSAPLKNLVESNFERFVRAKATIDNVYTEMRGTGGEPHANAPPSPSYSNRHSRRISGIHFRNISTGSATGTASSQPPSKNALRKETDYGVKGVKGSLSEVSQKAEDAWGPALGGKKREENLKVLLSVMEKDREVWGLANRLESAINQRDYDKVREHYNAARRYRAEVQNLADKARQSGRKFTKDETYWVIVIGKMWAKVDEEIKTFKKDVWRRLSNPPAPPLPGISQAEEHMDLIGVLLHLGVDDSPIWVYLLSRYDHLRNKIAAVVERSKIEIEILRRRLALTDSPSSQTIAAYLRQASKERSENIDTEDVIDFWNCILTYITKLLSLSNGLLGEVVDFWESAQSFINGSKQKVLPTGYEGESVKHHQMTKDDADGLRNGVVELVGQLRDAVFSLFADPPAEDISSLFSPVPGSAGTPTTPHPAAAFSPTDGRIGRLDPNDVPSAAKKGESWEDFAFWPPHSNALSAVHYLQKILTLVAVATNEMANLGPVANNTAMYEKIRALIAGARERSMRAVCEAWSKDAESCKSMEDWIRAPEKRDQTRMPIYFEAFERKVLLGMQQVLYFSDTTAKPGTREIISAPPSKLLQMMRTQFVSTVYKAVSGMLDNSEVPSQADEDEWVLSAGLNTVSIGSNPGEILIQDAINASSRSMRLLLTMSNTKALRNEQVPALIQLFESSFSVKLADELKSIKDVFSQIDAKLFLAYTRPIVNRLTKTINDGINSPGWVPTNPKPDQVRPYVYSALMQLVIVHSEVSTTVSSTGYSSPLLGEILSYLLENVSQALLDGFKDRRPNTYTLPALMQATLDTEFIAQTMTQYGTPKAGEIQGQIYTELDKRTTNEARARLQQELGDMRIVLKKLREGSRNSFGCFKKQRSSDKERGRQQNNPTATA
ncbi:Exocyst complex component S5 [Cladophialophora chaetospira]|uniref:Exocyst complex component SEC5 n=1 Tax=Cladophialophora chaetospira TaxID=386627 RepID=A0AA39CHC5_9EURO|nr:Exocyst complex component S5 [Cladophialophora chaetospira]